MLWIKRTALALLLLALLAGGGAAVYMLRSLEVLDGRLVAAGLRAPVQVLRDAAGVTHVRAQNAHDVWLAIGYVHAQERSWQLEFNRRLMHGELSEILGAATLETDQLMRTLDIMGAARRQYAGLPPHARAALQAYGRGIRAFHERRPQALAPEFHLLGTQPGGGAAGAVWEPEDSVGWALMMALDLGGNWGNEFTRLRLAQTLDTERLWQLMPPYPGEPPASSVDLAALYRGLGVYRAPGANAAQDNTVMAPHTTATAPNATSTAALTSGPTTRQPQPESPLARQISAAMLAWCKEFTEAAGSSEGRGSNNWVLAGARTVSGKPLLANDPHLGLSAPAIWYFAALRAPAGRAADASSTPAINVIGATLPGLPFVVLGRSAHLAWGFTNTNPDVQDLYLEQINPADANQYRTPDGWAPFALRTETIRVKGAADVLLQVRSTRHGPVLSDAQPAHAAVLDLGKYVLALRWSALDANNQTVLAGLLSNQAQTLDELFQALAHYHAPMQNVLAADDRGRIRFKAVGRVPLRAAANDIRGVAPAPGWEPRYDWQGWLPYEQTPQDDGAATGWLATANQRVTAPGYPHYLTQDWAPPYRYRRIAQLIQARTKHDAASMQAIQADVTSLATLRLLPHLQAARSNHPLAAAAQAQLAGFDGRMAAERAAPLLFAAWADELARGLIAPRIGHAHFAATYGRRDYRAAVEGILERNDAWWCQPLSCAEQSTAALDRALTRLQAAYGSDPAQWNWGRAHPALSAHRPFGSVPLLAHLFDVRSPSPGDTYTVNAGQYNPGLSDGPFVNRHAPSLRAVYDLAPGQPSYFIYQTGQSGLPFSPRYRDMSGAWSRNTYRPLQLEPAHWAHQLVLEPAPPQPP